MTEKIMNILLVGVGGQGIITSSEILAQAAVNAGYDTKKSEIHGMSQRGGSVFSHIRFGKQVYSPLIAHGQADILLSLEEMETLRWLQYAHKNTHMVVCRNKIKPAMLSKYPEGIETELKSLCKRLTLLNPEKLITKIGNLKFFNVALLGLISMDLQSFNITDESWENAIKKTVPHDFFEANCKAFQIGKQYIKIKYEEVCI